MTLPLNQYVKVKDRYCIQYIGPTKEYLLLLSYLIPAIEAELPGLQIYLCGRDEFMPFGEKSFGLSQFEQKKNEMAYCRELPCDLIHHPVEQLLIESNLTLNHWKPPIVIQPKGHNVVLCPNGVIPTKNLNPQEIDKLKMKFGNFQITENVENADWVIGVESFGFWKAAMLGIKTTLIPTGLGMALYKKLFPSGEILWQQHI